MLSLMTASEASTLDLPKRHNNGLFDQFDQPLSRLCNTPPYVTTMAYLIIASPTLWITYTTLTTSIARWNYGSGILLRVN